MNGRRYRIGVLRPPASTSSADLSILCLAPANLSEPAGKIFRPNPPIKEPRMTLFINPEPEKNSVIPDKRQIRPKCQRASAPAKNGIARSENRKREELERK